MFSAGQMQGVNMWTHKINTRLDATYETSPRLRRWKRDLQIQEAWIGTYSQTPKPSARRKCTFCVDNVFPSKERENVLMILPQVHLRKPCYDFYFL